MKPFCRDSTDSICFLSHSDIVWARSSFRAVSGLLPAVTAVEGAGISPFSQLNVWRSLPAVTLDVSSSCRPKPLTRRTPLELCVAGYTCTTRRVHALQLASQAGKAALMAVGLPAGPLRLNYSLRESSPSSYAWGGYFVGVLPVRCLTTLRCNLVVNTHCVNNFMWFECG